MALGVTNLVGFGAKRAAAAATSDFAFIGETTNSASGYSVSFHGSAAAGDVAIVAESFDGTVALTGTTATPPTGWSVFDDTVTDTIGFRGVRDLNSGIYYKVLTSGDISTGSVSSQITGGADTNQLMACQIWRPVSTPSFSDQEVAAGLTGADVSVTASSGTPPTLVVGAACGAQFDTNTSPAFTQTTTVGTGTSGLSLGVTYYDASPSSQTVDSQTAATDSQTFVAYSNLSFA